MDPLVTATLISTGANMLGGFLNKSSGPKSPNFVEASQYNEGVHQRAVRNQIPLLVEGAKKAGIHPLAALGVPVSSPNTLQPFGDAGGSSGVGDFLSNAGQGVSRAVEAYMTREDRAISRASAALDLENKRLQNTRLASEIRLLQAGSTPGLPGKVHDRSIWARDRDGKLTEVLNPDLGDNEFMMAQDWMTRTLPQDIKNMSRRTFEAFSSPRTPGGWLSRKLRSFGK